MRCLCRAVIVKIAILGILAILAFSLHIGYEQGPVVDMEGPPHRVSTVLVRMRKARTWRLPPGRAGESTVPRRCCKAPIFRPAYPQGVGKEWAISTRWVARGIIRRYSVETGGLRVDNVKQVFRSRAGNHKPKQ